MRKAQLLISALLLVLLLVACAPQATPVPQVPAAAPVPAAKPAAPAIAPAAPVKATWEKELEKVVEAAKAEGTLVLYTAMGGEPRRILTAPFAGEYGLRIESVTGSPAILTPKILAERRAGIYSVDVWLSGSTSWVSVKDVIDPLNHMLILPELTEPELVKKTWYLGEITWANKAHTMLVGLMDLKHPVTINTSLVKAGEIKTYGDLLDPKWKGRISLNDPRIAGEANMWFSIALETGDVDVNYMRELVTKQEPVITADWRLQVEWLAKGKYSIGIATHPATTTEFINLGAPIESFVIGTPAIGSGTSGIAMLNRAPHPNAAKLFVNWLLSKDGNTFLSRAVGAQSRRLDVPTDHLRPGKVLKSGLKVFSTDNEEFAAKKDTTYRDLAKEILGAK